MVYLYKCAPEGDGVDPASAYSRGRKKGFRRILDEEFLQPKNEPPPAEEVARCSWTLGGVRLVLPVGRIGLGLPVSRLGFSCR